MSYTDAFGERMKQYEKTETNRFLYKDFPIYARIDGRSFSTFTKGLNRPYDDRMLAAMAFACRTLVDKTHAKIGYVQSDEISLIWEYLNPESEMLFGGKVHKLTSILASMATAAFHWGIENNFGFQSLEYRGRMPHFDCRVINLPNRVEAANMLLWRAMDAKKNAVSMVAQHYFSHKQLHGADQKKMKEMLLDATGTHFETDYPKVFREGMFFRRNQIQLDPEQLLDIPEQYRPTEPVFRSVVSELDMPSFNTVTNREAVIFDGAEPTTRVYDE